MAKQEWEIAQDEFEAAFNKGKFSYCHRFPDSLDATRGNYNNPRSRFVKLPPQPSDFIVVWNGIIFFAEVKSTKSTTGISSSLFKNQAAQKLKILNAGGIYYFFVKRISTGQWYRLPGNYPNLNAKWSELDKFLFDIQK